MDKFTFGGKIVWEPTQDYIERWCVDGGLNIVYNCVDKWAENPETKDNPAVLREGEEGEAGTLTFGELNDEVNRCANALRELGFKKGDAIGIYMPMTPEIVVALFAIAKIGAVILPLFSGYGPQAVAERLNDAGAMTVFSGEEKLFR
jgi:acetyl-CoA synthetase